MKISINSPVRFKLSKSGKKLVRQNIVLRIGLGRATKGLFCKPLWEAVSLLGLIIGSGVTSPIENNVIEVEPEVEAPRPLKIPAVWCVLHRDGWCACATRLKPKDVLTSVPTKCDCAVVLPYGYSKRQPTCPACIAVLTGA